MKSDNPLLDAALNYRQKHGFSIIPCRPDKKPLIRWEEFQTRKPEAEEIRAWYKKHPEAKIGIVTGEISQTCAIDIDKLESLAKIADVVEGIQYPAAQTPRGGYHYHFNPPNPCPGNATGKPEGVDFRGQGGFIICPPSPGYAWLPGRSMDEVARPPLPVPYLSLLKNAFNKGGYREDDNDNTTWFTKGRRDEDLFSIANALIKNRLPESMVKQVLEKLALSCSPEFDLKEAREKVLSALKRVERRERNLTAEVREWVLSTNGVFLSTDVFKSLQLSTREEQKNLSIILRRLREEGVIEKNGERNGQFRLIDTEAADIDFINVTGDPLAVCYPFQVERLVKTMPKNIIIIAGEPNAGKTAFLLGVVALNMKSHRVHYFSSEMGALELKERLQKFDLPLDQWRFKAKERADNFADVIRPDDLNIVDFLEVHADFWKVGGMIKDIHDRLKSGVAVVAIQKNRGSDYGLGGGRGLEKPRLYLSMEPGLIKIIKAKNWADGRINPNGLQRGFKLVNGCEFFPTTDWKKA